MLIKLTSVELGNIAVGTEHILSVIPELIERFGGVVTKVSVPGFTYTVRESVDQILALEAAVNDAEVQNRFRRRINEEVKKLRGYIIDLEGALSEKREVGKI